jgi:peptidoglycan/LPS O-acetylase OafA/YrhL
MLNAPGLASRIYQASKRRLWLPLCETVREAYQKQDYPLGYTPALDGLRGLMTVGILVAHTRYPLVPGALLYMDVFFVMSGYFITSLLLRDIDRHNGIRFVEFYRRRFARILPPFAVMVAVYLTYRALFFPSFGAALLDAGIAFTYVANWWSAFGWPGIAYMSHTWSLAIEEQFYLLWPLVLTGLMRLLGVRWRLVIAILAIALAIWVWRIILTMGDPPFWRLYYGADTRADALAVGCALGVALKLAPAGSLPNVERFLPKLAWPFVISSLAVTFFFVQYQNPFYYIFGIMLFGVLPGAVLVTMLIRSSGTVVHRILERPEPVYLGKIFYGMYLWHFPILFILKDQFGAPNLVRFLIGFPLTVLLATLSYAYVERHFMRTRAKAPQSASKPVVPHSQAAPS